MWKKAAQYNLLHKALMYATCTYICLLRTAVDLVVAHPNDRTHATVTSLHKCVKPIDPSSSHALLSASHLLVCTVCAAKPTSIYMPHENSSHCSCCT
jgi:hypothetical protein